MLWSGQRGYYVEVSTNGKGNWHNDQRLRMTLLN